MIFSLKGTIETTGSFIQGLLIFKYVKKSIDQLTSLNSRKFEELLKMKRSRSLFGKCVLFSPVMKWMTSLVVPFEVNKQIKETSGNVKVIFKS